VSEPRLKSALVVAMALRMAERDGRFGLVARHGDDDAGGILLVLRGREGCVVCTQVRAADGEAAWLRGTGPDPVAAEAAEAYVQRQLRVDPDLWVVEIDGPDCRLPFAARILS
jgi:hypothetical protein